MTKLIYALAALGLLAMDGIATAADMPVKARFVEPLLWSGAYIGLNGGYGWRDSSISFGGNSAAETLYAESYLPRSVGVDPRGALGGIQAGYNMQRGRMVYGFEVDFDAASIKGGGARSGQTATFICDPFLCPATGTAHGDQKLDWFGTARVRLGMLASQQALLYLTGGLAYGHANVSASVTSVPASTDPQEQFVCPGVFNSPTPPGAPSCGSGSASRWLVGWTLGGGLEYALSAKWSVKLEYLYYDLGRATSSFNSLSSSAMFTSTADYLGHIVRAGVNVKF